MKVGILGSGIVGKTLANGLLKNGHSVMIGTRTVAKLDDWKLKAGANATVGSFEDAAKFGELIILAAKGTVASETLKLAGASFLKGKTVIDATNPISDAPPQNGVLNYFTTMDESLMERFQKQYPEVNFVKAFNCVGNAFMVDPDFNGLKPSMFICGNNANAKTEVKTILTQLGWEYEDMGGVDAARAIEPLCILWCIPGFLGNQWNHAFKLLKK